MPCGKDMVFSFLTVVFLDAINAIAEILHKYICIYLYTTVAAKKHGQPTIKILYMAEHQPLKPIG